MKTTKKKIIRLGRLAIESLAKLPARTNVEFDFNKSKPNMARITITYFDNALLNFIVLYMFLPYEENLHRLQSAIKAIENESMEEFTNITLNKKESV